MRPGKPNPRRSPASAAEKESRLQEDLVLIEMILGGSTAHWHAFVDRYAGLIYSVIRRQLFVEDDDEVRTVFADVLEALYKGKLAEFRGGSELSTWLIVVSRGKALDHLRHLQGRRKMPQGYAGLSAFEQQVFRLHHVEGLAFDAVIHSLHSAGMPANAEMVAHAVLKIEGTLDKHYLRRLESDAKAPALGVVSGRLLDYLTHAGIERDRAGDEDPHQRLERDEVARLAARVQELLGELTDEEQDIVRLRFEEGWTAQRIADHRGLAGQRRVYTLLDGALRKLRKLLDRDDG
ncbi:MAG TPA: sigma-70 family RNA polymerase sigma factor [Candidatus Krumholzibacteria bacterium]|nr:sigma-70 family RNA polymerase sigma factor [Candidatus Krumholzibacteria bacterium]